MNDIGGSAVIVEDGEPRYVVVPIHEWERIKAKGSFSGGVEKNIEHEEVIPEMPSHSHPFADGGDLSLEYEESPLEALDTFETPSYPV